MMRIARINLTTITNLQHISQQLKNTISLWLSHLINPRSGLYGPVSWQSRWCSVSEISIKCFDADEENDTTAAQTKKSFSLVLHLLPVSPFNYNSDNNRIINNSSNNNSDNSLIEQNLAKVFKNNTEVMTFFRPWFLTQTDLWANFEREILFNQSNSIQPKVKKVLQTY